MEIALAEWEVNFEITNVELNWTWVSELSGQARPGKLDMDVRIVRAGLAGQNGHECPNCPAGLGRTKWTLMSKCRLGVSMDESTKQDKDKPNGKKRSQVLENVKVSWNSQWTCVLGGEVVLAEGGEYVSYWAPCSWLYYHAMKKDLLHILLQRP